VSRRVVAVVGSVTAFLLWSSVAEAQIFNVQPLLDKQSRDGFSGALEGAADWRSGNTNILMLTGNGVVQYRKQRHLVFIDIHGEYGLQGTNELVSKDLEHARYRYRLSRAIDFEAFVQHDADAFRRLAVRAVAGVGARLRLVEGKHVTLAVAGAYMPDYERLSAGLFPDSRAQSLAHRLSTYAVIAVSAGKIMVAHTIYAQPRFDDFHDVRMLSDSSLSLTVTKHVAVRFSLTMTLDTEPPAGIRPVDSELKSTLSFSF
jgi:putative salt-induced outer membrane protein YdiY